MSKLSYILATSALASALALGSGCATTRKSADYVSSFGDAKTNTIPLSSGAEKYKFREGRIDEIFAGGDTYALMPMANNTAVRTNGKTLDNKVILAARFVPYSDSSYIRTEKEIKLVPHEKVFYAVNAHPDAANKLVLNETSQERSSFFVVGYQNFPSRLRPDEMKIIQNRFLEDVKKQVGFVQINGERYISLPANNPFGPGRVLIPEKRQKPVYFEKRTPAGITVQWGLNGPGYFLTQGEEVALPVDPAANGMKVLDITEPKVK